LKHQTPIQALQKWRSEKPDFFVKRVSKQTGLDTPGLLPLLIVMSKLFQCEFFKTHETSAETINYLSFVYFKNTFLIHFGLQYSREKPWAVVAGSAVHCNISPQKRLPN